MKETHAKKYDVRYMDVSSREHFGPKTVDPKTLGKKIMKD
jgi:hypothetical protein